MSLIRLDYEEIFPSGVLSATEVATSGIFTQGIDGLAIVIDSFGDGADAIEIRPEYSYEYSVTADALESGDFIFAESPGGIWAGGTLGEFDATNNRTQLNDDVLYMPLASGVVSRRTQALDTNAAMAVRLQVKGVGTINSSAVRIRVARLATHTTGKRLF